jgi:hypothetical protein
MSQLGEAPKHMLRSSLATALLHAQPFSFDSVIDSTNLVYSKELPTYASTYHCLSLSTGLTLRTPEQLRLIAIKLKPSLLILGATFRFF